MSSKHAAEKQLGMRADNKLRSRLLPVEYVVGFYFYSTARFESDRQIHNTNVTLIQKRRPEWMQGMLNGVGGHVKPGERPVQAMVREFREEAGYDVPESRWTHFLRLSGLSPNGAGYVLNFFRAFHEGNSADYFDIKAQTDEPIFRFPIEEVLHWRPVVPNLKWILPLAFQDGLIVAEQVD